MAINSQGPAPQQAPKSLFQQVQGNLQKMAAPQSLGGILGATEDVARISQAATGKAAPEGMEGPQRDVQQELAVVDQVQQGQKAIARDSQLSQLAMQQADQQIQNEASFEARKMDEEELNRLDALHQTQSRILADYTNGQRTLDFGKDKARLEQLGFASRLSDDKYLRDLQMQANKARLSDAARFEEEMTRTVFAEEEELLRDSLDFRALMAADTRQFTEAMTNINLDFAKALANANNRAANERAMWEGIGGIVSAGVKYGASESGGKTLDRMFAPAASPISTYSPNPTVSSDIQYINPASSMRAPLGKPEGPAAFPASVESPSLGLPAGLPSYNVKPK